MNCDQAFDVMTSTRRARDRALPVHLAGCPRCREMQATLEPALGLFQDELDSAQRREPWTVPADGHEFATQAAQRLMTAAPAPRPEMTGLWGYAASIVLGAGLVWCMIMMQPATSPTPAVDQPKAHCLYLSDSRPLGRSGPQMTQSCLACHPAPGRQ